MSKAQDVIEFLKSNPRFLLENEDLIADLDTAEEQSGNVFYERQLKVLRERENQQKARLELIVDGARDNQKLESDLTEVAIRLLSHDSSNELPAAMVVALVKRQFNIKGAVVLLNSDGDRHAKYDEVRQRVMHKSSICDDRVSSQLMQGLFEEEYEAIKSCAFVPLTFDDQLIGVMILGSNSAERFQPGVGVMFLDRLGQLVAAYIKGREI